jgi:hypothetical protein
VDVIRELFASGVPVASIARQLGVRYQIAYVAVRGMRKPPEGSQDSPAATALGEPDAILIGCVSQKNEIPMPAKDLYRSELFRRRRLWAESSGKPWWIISAEYGLVDPDQEIRPYDTRIGKLSPDARQRLARQVASALEARLAGISGRTLELHAGDDYFLTIAPRLRQEGARIVRPLEGLRIGEQLGWYGDHLGLERASARSTPRPPRVSTPSLIGEGRGLSRLLTQLFVDEALDLSDRPKQPLMGWPGMPEIRAVNKLRAAGADDVEVRLFLTFNAAMDRARDADLLADAAVRMWRIEPWTVNPKAVVDRPLTELSDVLRRFGVSQRHAADSFAWRVIAESLHQADIAPVSRSAIFEGHADARQLLDEVTSASADGTQRFPLLGGPKISALWVRLLAYPGSAQISSLDAIPVAVDVQVRKVTEYLGVTDTGEFALEDVRAAIQETWSRDVAAHGASGPGGLQDTPGALDPALWYYGKWGVRIARRSSTRDRFRRSH